MIDEPPRKKEGKRVKWDETQLESIKFFKLTDLPAVNGLNYE